jgi:hypothetical protein
MRIRANPLALLVFCTFSFILNTFAGLAGPLSTIISVLLPSVLLASLIQLALSWHFFSWHQVFSCDHPQKGETVRYLLHTANESRLPLAQGACKFSSFILSDDFTNTVGLPSGPGETRNFEAGIHCSWRGTYSIGISGFSFTDALGLISIEEQIEPRVFYVYPELVTLDSRIEKLARSSGSDQPGIQANDGDSAIFEYIAPLRESRYPKRIAWKRWAATGIPGEIIHGKSRSTALTIVLDLWPGYSSGVDKLASEDVAVSAVFSVLQYLSREQIPAELILGGDERGIPVDSTEAFNELLSRSTNIIFSDERFPFSAFSSGPAVLLVTTRPLIEQPRLPGSPETDLFTAFEDALLRGTEPHILLCPPPSQVTEQRACIETLAERQSVVGGITLLRLAEPGCGPEEIAHALCSL